MALYVAFYVKELTERQSSNTPHRGTSGTDGDLSCRANARVITVVNPLVQAPTKPHPKSRNFGICTLLGNPRPLWSRVQPRENGIVEATAERKSRTERHGLINH